MDSNNIIAQIIDKLENQNKIPLKNLYPLLDADGDGVLTVKEFVEGLPKIKMANPLSYKEEEALKNCAFQGDLLIIDENELLNNIYG
jgi:hypothetical protein